VTWEEASYMTDESRASPGAQADFAGRVRRLVATMADRMPAGVRESVLSLARHGEEGLALAALAASLETDRPPITRAECAALRDLMAYFDESDLGLYVDDLIRRPDEILAAMNVVDP
jgi:hypothetical protein